MEYIRNVLGFFQRSYSIYSGMAVHVYACLRTPKTVPDEVASEQLFWLHVRMASPNGPWAAGCFNRAAFQGRLLSSRSWLSRGWGPTAGASGPTIFLLMVPCSQYNSNCIFVLTRTGRQPQGKVPVFINIMAKRISARIPMPQDAISTRTKQEWEPYPGPCYEPLSRFLADP